MATPSNYSSSGEEHSTMTWSDTDEDVEEPPAKRVKLQSESDSSKQSKSSSTKHHDHYSLVSQRIMASMGYQVGKGLGKFSTGITQPVEESIQKGRRGLGYMLEGLEKEEVQWEQEEVHYDQHPEWLGHNDRAVPTIEEFAGWISIGEKKQSIDDETQFCDSNVLEKILDGKTVFDSLSEKEFLDARQRSNPFETIKGTIFQNRAAMKMANIDSVFEYMFTSPKKSDGTSLLGPFDVLYFADICAGPGGFSEYVLWRKKWHARGFGMTLKDPDDASDFKLDKFLAAPCETFDPHYGVNGYDGDGDITKPDNLIAFREYVMSQTEGRGVHFVMGDGGISVEGLENIQEILTKQLVLCQYICALSILRTGGHFVCKVFDMFTPFSAGLFYLLYRCFRTVCLFKPVTSRPANSERYVVCRELLPGHEAVHDYLFAVNEELVKLNKTSQMDILEVVPAAVLEEEDDFTSYLRAFNDSFGVNQTLHLKKLQYFVKNINLQDTRQAEIRKKCLDIWKVPNAPRTAPSESNPLEIFNEFWVQLSTGKVDVLDSSKFATVDKKESVNFLEDVHSWKWYFACGRRMMIVGVGRNMVYAWDMKGIKPMFAPKVKELNGLELPKGTVLEVEFVQELQGEGRGQRKQDTVYVIDVIAIHGQLFANKPLKERHLYAQKLCKVVNKPSRKGVVRLRTKELYRVADLYKQFNKISLKECKGFGVVPTVPVSHDTNEFIMLTGVIFIKSIKDPWQLHLSRSGKFYYFNRQTGQSLFECPSSSVASYMSVLQSRHIWIFNRSTYNELCSSDASEASKVDTDNLTKHHLCQIIQHFMHSR